MGTVFLKEMNLTRTPSAEKKGQNIRTCRKIQKRRILVMLISMIGGISSGALGLLMSGAAYFGIVKDAREINQIGTWLIVAAFALIMLGAYCLDKIEGGENQIR